MSSVPGQKATLGEAAVFRPGQIPEKHSPENCGPPTIPVAGGRKRNISASVPKWPGGQQIWVYTEQELFIL